MNSAKRIIHVPRRFVVDEWGGTETVIAAMVEQQRLQGWLPEIHTSRALSRVSSELWHDVPVERYSYCYPFFGLSDAQRHQLDKKGGNMLSLSLLFSMLRAKDVRLFHAHTLKRLGGAVMLAAHQKHKPFVVTLHGGVYDVPAAEQKEMLAAQDGKMEWGKVFGAIFHSRALLEEADAVICVGRTEYERALAALSHKRVYHVGNGVDAERFKAGDGTAFRTEHSIPADAFVLGCYCRIDPQKDQLSLVEAFDRLAASHPLVYLVLSGPCTSSDYLAQLDLRIAASPHATRIRRLGAISNEGTVLPNAYHACDVFVLPSRHEPFGIVVLEAWSAGKPVVVAEVGGLRHLVTDAENGLFFPSGDSAALAACLERLILNPDLRDSLGAAGQQLARSQYSWKQVAHETERVYQLAEVRVQK